MSVIHRTSNKDPSKAAIGSTAHAQRHRIIMPGRNCWRVEQAQRAAVLVDGADYFANLEAALRRARQSVLILGWDFDGAIRLRPDVDSADSPPLGRLLRSLVEAQPDLEIRILVWSIAVIHAPGAPGPLLFGADWQEHPRLHVKLDTHHPLYAAHHQKIVVIDDQVAFVGGMDLTIDRWDTPSHNAGNPHRITPDGTPYGPVHDIQMAVDGEAACAIAELARRRWHIATGEELKQPIAQTHDPWPADLEPAFIDIPVAIARTMPAWKGERAIDEVATLTIDALEAARQTIYIETQYLTASRYSDILESQLRKPDGPEIVVLMTHKSHGFAERTVMGVNRDRLIRRLKRADQYGRLRVCYPCVPDGDGHRRQVLIHSKLIIIDNVFVRIGSSNLNNRSIGLDTECDLALEAEDETTRQTIINLRNRLIAEHLGATIGDLAATLDEEGGSLMRAIDRLNQNPRGLQSFEATQDHGPTQPVLGTSLLDPKRPFKPFRFLRRKLMGQG